MTEEGAMERKGEWTEHDQSVLMDLIKCWTPDSNGRRAFTQAQLEHLESEYPETARRFKAAIGQVEG
jgi:hypothetical protein